jgi:hypothetical protein
VRRGEGANEGEREGSREGTSFYIAGWVQSRVHRDGCHWAWWAASGDGVVSRFQGTRRWRRWLAGSRVARAVSERERAKQWAAGACWCLAVQGEGGVASAGPCRAGVREE